LPSAGRRQHGAQRGGFDDHWARPSSRRAGSGES